MKKYFVVIVFNILFIMNIGLVGKAIAEEIRIGMVNITQGAPYFVGMAQAVMNEASFYTNIEVTMTDAKGSTENLIANLRDISKKKVDGIIISAGWIDANVVAPEITKIYKSGIPVVLVDRQVKGSEYTSWVGPHNFLIGEQVGQYIADRLNGKGRLIIIRGGPEDNPIGLDRTNGVISQIEKTDIEIIKAQGFGGWSNKGGSELMAKVLKKYKKIDAVFCENDSMCLGAQEAILEAKRQDEIFLAGVDGEKAALLSIADDTNYAATGLNNSDQIGRAAFHRMMGILAGGNAEKDTVLASPLISINNVLKFYNPNSVF